jgi:hypothetical protein
VSQQRVLSLHDATLSYVPHVLVRVVTSSANYTLRRKYMQVQRKTSFTSVTVACYCLVLCGQVKAVMTPKEKVYMLSADARLSFKTISEIFKTGFSRIPVYGSSRDDIVGILMTKDLIFIDPEDETPVKNFVQIFGRSLQVMEAFC